LKKPLLTYLLLAGFGASLVALIVHLRSYPFPGNQEGYEPTQPIAYSHKLHAGDLGMSCLYCHYSAAKGPHAGIPPASLCMNCHRLVTASWDATRSEAEKARQEGRPPRRIISPDLQKLYDALGLDAQALPALGSTMIQDMLRRGYGLNDQALPVFGASAVGLMGSPLGEGPVLAASALFPRPTQPIRWVKVHNLPHYTRFDHRAHVNAGVICQECHGKVETMDVIRQSASLSMGWCVRCHKSHKEIAGKKVSPSTDCATCHY
jgi:Cytochrome c7 and related cytochrome c